MCLYDGFGEHLPRGATKTTLTYQNLQKSRAPINSILGFIIRTYKKVGFGRLRYTQNPDSKCPESFAPRPGFTLRKSLAPQTL